MSAPILPGGTIGVLGGGQQGRMLAFAARRMGYRVRTFSPEQQSPAAQVADVGVVADLGDLDAVRAFARDVDVVTVEFENIPLAALHAACDVAPVRPAPGVVETAQHRLREKAFLERAGFPVAPFAPVREAGDLPKALAHVALPAILKTVSLGYDGKGQVQVASETDAAAAIASLAGAEAILETRLDLEYELSVIAARGVAGSVVAYGPIQNRHRAGILDLSFAPADADESPARASVEITSAILEELDVVGVLCVEFFVTRDGQLLVNELAPRPHNSGHLTIEACVAGQFEQHVRAICGLPLGTPRLHSAAAMANLLGDLWRDGEPDWAASCAVPHVALHLYGKSVARAGRKMGHVTALAADAPTAVERALAARRALVPI